MATHGMNSLVITTAERQRRDKLRNTQFRKGVVFGTAASKGGKAKRQGAADARIIQDPAVYVNGIPADTITPETVSDAAFSFVSNSNMGAPKADAADDQSALKLVDILKQRNARYEEGLANLNAASKGNKEIVKEVFKNTYVLDPVPYVPTSSAMAPTLRWATTRDADIKVFLDAAKRIVVKMYPLDAIIDAFMAKGTKAADEKNRDRISLVDLVNDIVISHYLTSLVRDYDRVVTPHFAFPVDWFIGPKIDGDEIKYARDPETSKFQGITDVKTKSDSLAQYVVVERADMTLKDVMRSPSVSVKLMRSLLWQILYSLESGWQYMGYLHYDAHSENFMVRNLLMELDSPYLNRSWAYKRAGVPDFYYLTLSDHGHLFVEIIDAGRSRAFVTLDDDPARKLHLIGYPMREDYGIFVDGGPERVDRAWDVRRLGIDLLFALDIEAMVSRQVEGSEDNDVALAPRSEKLLAQQFMDLIGHMVGGVSFVRAVDRAGEKWSSTDGKKKRGAVQQQAELDKEKEGKTQLWALLKETAKTLMTPGADTSNEAIYRAFSKVASVARGASWYYGDLFFDVVINTIFFYHIVDPPTADLYRTTDLNATTCIERAFFDGLNGKAIADDAVHQSALITGFVTKKHVLKDSYLGIRQSREDESTTADGDPSGADLEDAQELALARKTKAASKAAGNKQPERRSARLKPVGTHCVVCGDLARGYAVPEHVAYCGSDCMWSDATAHQ